MYKLLPDEERVRVAAEYSRRRVVVVLLTLILVIIVAMVGLFPSYLLSNARQREVLERGRIMGELDLDEDEAQLQSWLSNLNLKLRALSPALDRDRPSALVEEVVRGKTDGIRITTFGWNKEEKLISLSISGVARDRQALIALENSLNASGHFETVELPISNLARDKDINFQVKLSPKP
ncbi:MAG: hypothetical protein Q7R67_01580 [bacterium]|nr:hypothetical protein [bacterium]